MKKAALSVLLVFVLLFTAAPPLTLASRQETAAVTEVRTEGRFSAFFRGLFDGVKQRWEAAAAKNRVKKEGVKSTYMQNAIHMLRSVTDTIGDSFIITTADGKVIVVDGGHRTETNYFLAYLKAVTGEEKPHIDVWFLSHPHDDHCEVFLEVAERHADEVTFDKVYANFPEPGFYEGYDEWGVYVINEFNRLKPAFADKVAELHEGDVLDVGDARFTVFYTFNPEWKNVNESSAIMRMDLAGTRVMFTGDAETNAGNYVVEKYGDTGELKCDYCKMSHHGQGGVDRNFYEAVDPDVCLWPTPTWVYDNVNGNLKTFETRQWVEELGVKKEYKSFEGSAVIPLIPRVVSTTDVFEDGYPAEKALDRLARLGFEGIDMGFDYWTFENSPFLSDDYLTWAEGLRKRADDLGVPYTHAHAPGDAGDYDMAVRSIRAASVLGARYLVVHPIHTYANGKTINAVNRFIAVNAEAIEKLLPVARECGVTILSENILWGASKNPRAIARLVKAVDSPYFSWCFDTGHAHCTGFGADILKKCAVVPASLHVQDNDGSGDRHLIPGDGDFDFDLFLKTLGEVHYVGDCVMEAHHQSLDAPDDERDPILARLLEVSKGIREAMRFGE